MKNKAARNRKAEVKSQKSKVLWNKLFRAFQWSAYLRRAVLETAATRDFTHLRGFQTLNFFLGLPCGKPQSVYVCVAAFALGVPEASFHSP